MNEEKLLVDKMIEYANNNCIDQAIDCANKLLQLLNQKNIKCLHTVN